MKTLTFEKIIKDITANFNKVKKSAYLDTGQFKIIDQGQKFIAGYTNNSELVNNKEGPVIVFGDHTKIFKYIDFPFAIGADGVKVLKVISDNANTKFVYYFLKAIKLPEAGYSRHFKYLKIIRIPIPENIEDQIRIATLLSRADELITKRKESIHLLDELLKSTFLERFGDHAKIQFIKHKFDDLKANQNGTFSNGPFGSDLLTSELTDFGVPVIYIRDIRDGCFKWIKNVYVSEEKANSLPNCVAMPGDLLIAKVRDPPGIAAIYPKNLNRSIITQDLIRIRLNKEIATPEYLKFYLNSILGKRLIKRITIKGTRSRFPLNKLKQLKIQIPDLNLQNQFAQFVQKTEALKAKYQSSLHELENLYGSLSQRAFREELNLSKIPIQHEVVVHDSLQIHDEPSLTVLSKHTEEYVLTIDGLKALIQDKLPKKFTFKMLLDAIEEHVAEENQNFKTIKDLLTDLLQGEKHFLNQKFGIVKTNEIRNEEQKQIFFCVNK